MASETSGGSVRTFLVFTDLPKHIEYAARPMPVLPDGVVIRIDRIPLRDPSDRRRVRLVEGEYEVRRRLVYEPASGLVQYLELSPLPTR